MINNNSKIIGDKFNQKYEEQTKLLVYTTNVYRKCLKLLENFEKIDINFKELLEKI